MTSSIHASAIVARGATVGAGASIGPWCQVGPEAVIGAGARLISHVVVDGRTRIGEAAVLYPFCTVGMAPQDLKYRGEPTSTEVGARTQLREHVTIHRGTATGSGLTVVGSDCLLMACVHIAHDCVIGNSVVIANNVVMGGHVEIAETAIIGGGAAIIQFARIGRGAIIGGLAGVEGDVIPFGNVIGNRGRLAGLNLIGLKRRGLERARINTLRAAFRLLFRGAGVFAERVAQARQDFGAEALVAEILDFMEQPGRRGLIRSAVLADDDDNA